MRQMPFHWADSLHKVILGRKAQTQWQKCIPNRLITTQYLPLWLSYNSRGRSESPLYEPFVRCLESTLQCLTYLLLTQTLTRIT